MCLKQLNSCLTGSDKRRKEMKKIFMMFVWFCIAACKDASITEQKFVNPLFYKTMEPVSTNSWRTKITPTSMVRDNKGTVLEQKCTLVENTMEAVTLNCEGAYEKEIRTLYRFVLKGNNGRGMIIYMHDKYPREEKFSNQETFIIYEYNQ